LIPEFTPELHIRKDSKLFRPVAFVDLPQHGTATCIIGNITSSGGGVFSSDGFSKSLYFELHFGTKQGRKCNEMNNNAFFRFERNNIFATMQKTICFF
jgi:hypothetical protein